MRRRLVTSLLGLAWAVALAAEQPAPVLRMPGAADRPIAPASLVGKSSRDIRLEGAGGDVTIYHGTPLLDLLEQNGLDIKTMAGERRTAATVVLAAARDGYTVVFSVGELRANRANPRVFLVAETAAGPLPEKEGPVRLVVYGDVVRSAYGLARIELKALADDSRPDKK